MSFYPFLDGVVVAGRPAAELLLDNCAASLVVYTHITTINRIRRERG
jgi:hypothetical protein